ncbi:MAG: glycosyltransferase family 4 protein, partial [Nitrospinaceae bacterium]
MARNILLLTSTFPRWEDDAQVPRFILDLGRKLTADFRVHVLAPHAPNAAREETLHGMRVLRHRYFFPESLQTLAYGAGIPNNLRANPLRWLQAPPFFLGQWRAL